MRIALTYNLKPGFTSGADRKDYYAEWDDSATIEAVSSALAALGPVELVEADENIVEGLKHARPDIVFNIAEGINSQHREAQVPIICDMLRIPYTGSDAFTLAACLNKARAKQILSYYRIPTPQFQVFNSADEPLNGLRFPVVVKPLWEGSSMGIYNDSVVDRREELYPRLMRICSEYRQPALVESYLKGREFTVALLGNGTDIRVLPLVEIDFRSLPPGANRIYSYEAKWVWDTPDAPLNIFACPAVTSPGLEDKIRETCLSAYRALGCRDWCRIDVRLDGGDIPHIIELNPLPGILPDPEENSCFPKAARAAGMSYGELVREVLLIACDRCGIAVQGRGKGC